VGKNKVALAIILMVTGFIISFSYQYVQKMNEEKVRISSEQWQRENNLRKQLIAEQDNNRELQTKLDNVRAHVQHIEKKMSDQEAISSQLVKDLSTYRMVNGETKVKGPGVKVTLSDANYTPNGDNPNNYIVHQQDIQEVIYELLAAGAEGVSINGERFTAHSYIECVGPVVKVDGHKHAAPFIIRAIGDSTTLMDALNMNGGSVDLLIARGINVTVEKKDSIVLNPLL
jgi:uncharacterized protein YlxW (UPF0749 family)